MIERLRLLAALLSVPIVAACSGGGGGSSPGGYASPPTATPQTPAPPTPTPTASSAGQSTAQVISFALPSSSIGSQNDPMYGAIAGFTQSQYSQVLAFAPGAQVMMRNADRIPHTLGDLGQKSFPAMGTVLSPTPTGTTTFTDRWQSGNIDAGKMIGPITLTAGTYWIGCDYHYESANMRDVLVVQASATPGPQATQQANAPTPSPTSGGGYGY